MQKGHATPQLHDDFLRNLLRFLRHNQHRLAAIETCNHPVCHRGINKHANQGKHCRCHAEQKCRHQHNQAVSAKNHASHVQGIVFLDNGTNNIKAPCTAVHAKDNAITYTIEHTAKNCRQHQIIHRQISIQKPRSVQAQRKKHRTNYYVNRVLLPHQLPCRQQQRHVIYKCLDTNGQVRQIIKDDSNTRHATSQKVRRHQKQIDGAAGNQAAQGNTGVMHNFMLQGSGSDYSPSSYHIHPRFHFADCPHFSSTHAKTRAQAQLSPLHTIISQFRRFINIIYKHIFYIIFEAYKKQLVKRVCIIYHLATAPQLLPVQTKLS